MSGAWVFPGQGSQYVGMAVAWAARSPVAQDALSEAAAVLGFDLAALMAEGPAKLLADTYNQQPALLAASVAILRAAREELPEPAYVAGHSLGEYSALVAAGVLDYPAALGLVRERGRLMRLAGEKHPGRMAAVLGIDDEVVKQVCAAVEGVQVANFNAPGQVVISGGIGAVDKAAAELTARGAKRIVVLPITIAAHSRLMAPVAEEYAAALKAASLRHARVPVVANVTARPLQDPADLRVELASQLTASVRWAESVRFMADAGVDAFYEIGPGDVLCRLVKRIFRGGERPLRLARSLSEPLAA